MLKLIKYSCFLILIYSCNNNIDSNTENWEIIFNGKDLKDWEIKFANQNLNINYKNTFQIKDSILKVVYDNYDSFDNNYGQIYYKKPYSYYKLKFEYRFTGNQTKGGAGWAKRNSGIMIHSQSPESNDFSQSFPVSIEVQLLGGLSKGERPTGNLCTPGTAVIMNEKINYNHCILSNSKTYDGEQWVRGEIIVHGGEMITHIIENDTVLSYNRPQIGGGFVDSKLGDIDWTSNGVENKEYWLSKEGEILKSGYIALQSESHPVDFRNIRLLDLCGCMDSNAKNYKSYFIKENNSECIY
tara:strand:- start:3487 stop:4380 length:894 start_codon:yes stop_codon:yes gene_type:complete